MSSAEAVSLDSLGMASSDSSGVVIGGGGSEEEVEQKDLILERRIQGSGSVEVRMRRW